MNNEEKIEKILELVVEAFKSTGSAEHKNSELFSTNQGACISVTGIQRKLGVGFPTAKEIMNKLIEREAVVEDDGRYYILSLNNLCSALTEIFNAEIPKKMGINARFSEIEESIFNKEINHKVKRNKEIADAFKKKKDVSFNVVDDIKDLIEKRAKFNISKDKILEFYDNNKTQIINIFNLNANNIESDMRFMHGIDYDEKIFANKDGKVHSYLKLRPTYLKDEKNSCLFLLCTIIKILWNKSHNEKIYSCRMFEFDDCDDGENFEIFDLLYGDCLFGEVNLLF